MDISQAQEAVVGLGIVTAVYAGFDALRPLPTNHGFDDAVCVTDDPQLHADGWRMILQPSDEHPRLAAKRPKFLPWEYVQTDASVWIDAAFEVRDKFKPFVDEHLAAHDFVVWKHPEQRTCLYAEARYCQDWSKYLADPIREQTAHYRDLGMPEDFGLFAAGAIGWRHTPAMRDFGHAWLQECQTWSIQDQISLPFLLWQRGITPGIWAAHEFHNTVLTYHPHARHE